jgi:hypothetical protein
MYGKIRLHDGTRDMGGVAGANYMVNLGEANSRLVPVGSAEYADVAAYAAAHPEMVTREFDERKVYMKKVIANDRYLAEVAGVEVNGVMVDTSRQSQALIAGAALQATIDSSYTLKWKTSAGFVDLTAAQVLALAAAVREYVQSQFDREAELCAAIDAAGTVEELDAVRWEDD